MTQENVGRLTDGQSGRPADWFPGGRGLFSAQPVGRLPVNYNSSVPGEQQSMGVNRWRLSFFFFFFSRALLCL